MKKQQQKMKMNTNQNQKNSEKIEKLRNKCQKGKLTYKRYQSQVAQQRMAQRNEWRENSKHRKNTGKRSNKLIEEFPKTTSKEQE